MSISTVMKSLSMAAAGAAFVTLSTGGTAQAIQIGSNAFGTNAVMESFEGLSPEANSPSSSSFGSGYLVPGTNSPYTFASGVTLTQPVPNSNQQVLIGDWSQGNASWTLGNNGLMTSAAPIVDGNAYLGIFSFTSEQSVDLTFASDVLRVGAFVTGGGDTTTLTAFDAFDNVLEAVTINNVNLSQWGSNFLGLENTSGIRRIQFSSADAIIDKLTFETASTQPVPEPASVLGLLAMGVLGVGSFRKRKQQ